MTLTQFANTLDRSSVAYMDRGVLRSAPLTEQLRCRFSDLRRQQNENRVMQAAIDVLKNAPRISPREAFKNREAYILRNWVKRTALAKRHTIWERNHKKQQPHPEFHFLRELQAEVTAYRLGITVENLRASEGLQKFREKGVPS